MNGQAANSPRGWRLRRGEWIAAVMLLLLLAAFGWLIEFRTALRRLPQTDLGVFCAAADAIKKGDSPYAIADWHGWHYHYPPFLAIVMRPLAFPAYQQNMPQDKSVALPWGLLEPGSSARYGLREENRPFFFIVLIWYCLGVVGLFLSMHLVSCAIEGRSWRSPPPEDHAARKRWWGLRLLPLLVCIASIGNDISRGQVGPLILLAISSGLYLASRRSNLSAGLALSIPPIIKLFPPLLLVHPLWRRQWRLLAGMAAGFVLTLLVLPVAVMGMERTVSIYRSWWEVLAKPALGTGSDASRTHELTSMKVGDNQSLLAALHNWQHFGTEPAARPVHPSPGTRFVANACLPLLLVAWAALAGRRRTDSPLEMTWLLSMLVGFSLIASPVVHHYYYLLMLPGIAALHAWRREHCRGVESLTILSIILVFALVDVLSKVPRIGPVLRDGGIPLLSLVGLLCAIAWALRRQRCTVKT